jgi:Family of unknown function (DUF5681)
MSKYYGKPPEATQFKRGQSGNPNGHPKGSNLRIDLAAELDEKITVREQGHSRRISKQRATTAMLALYARLITGPLVFFGSAGVFRPQCANPREPKSKPAK